TALTPDTSPFSRLSVFIIIPRPPTSTLFPYTTLFRSDPAGREVPRRSACRPAASRRRGSAAQAARPRARGEAQRLVRRRLPRARSEEHTSELQSRENLVCRLLLEKKKNNNIYV